VYSPKARPRDGGKSLEGISNVIRNSLTQEFLFLSKFSIIFYQTISSLLYILIYAKIDFNFYIIKENFMREFDFCDGCDCTYAPSMCPDAEFALHIWEVERLEEEAFIEDGHDCYDREERKLFCEWECCGKHTAEERETKWRKRKAFSRYMNGDIPTV